MSIIFIAFVLSMKNATIGIWQMAVDHFLPKLFTVEYLNCVLFC